MTIATPRGYALVLVVGAALVLAGCQVTLDASTGATYNATVIEVVDGDTVDVRLANGSTERIRLLGVDTPEVHVETDPAEFPGVPDTAAGRRCLRAAGENASAFLGERVAAERVRIEVDGSADRRGGYGRLLAYVHHDGTNLNHVLVARGHARVYETAFRERSRFESAADGARAADRGLWRCRAA